MGVIRVEVCFIPFRKDQKLFSDVDVLLRPYDFDLLRYEIDPHQIAELRRIGFVRCAFFLRVKDLSGKAGLCARAPPKRRSIFNQTHTAERFGAKQHKKAPHCCGAKC